MTSSTDHGDTIGQLLPPTSRVIGSVVQVAFDRTIWATVDLEAYVEFIKLKFGLSVCRPSRNFVDTETGSGTVKYDPRDRLDPKIVMNYGLKALNKHRRPQSLANFAVIEGRLVVVVSTDFSFGYRSLLNDFGPFDLSTTFRYINFVDDCIREAKAASGFAGNPIVVHIADRRYPQWCANSAMLSTAYSVVRHREAYSLALPSPFANLPASVLPPFRDAATGPSTFDLGLQDCARGLARGLDLGWVDFGAFDLARWERLQHVDHGDVSLIVPRKFVAFAGPADSGLDEDGMSVHTPEHYAALFRDLGVTDVVRLNVSRYSPAAFEEAGMRHHDLFLPDGSCPALPVVRAFLRIADAAKGVVAVHCKAGLGRTGTLIGLWAMRECRLTAREFLGWCRLARPGSVIGPQQHFLEEMQAPMWAVGAGRRLRKDLYSPARHLGSQSPVGIDGDAGQGNRLTRQKRSRLGLPRPAHSLPLISNVEGDVFGSCSGDMGEPMSSSRIAIVQNTFYT